MRSGIFLASVILGATSFACAHLKSGSLAPAGGETLKVGDVVTISWVEAEVHHERIDIALSKDNGANWTDIKTLLPDDDKNGSFKWTVPAIAVSAQAKFRICQSGPCNNSQGTSNPSGDAPWRLVSNAFAIQASAAIAAPAEAAGGFSIDYRPDHRNVEVTFSLAAEGPVSLRAFDMQGRMVAELLNGSFGAGAHRLSVFANRLEGAQGLVFKLQAYERSVSNAWMPLY